MRSEITNNDAIWIRTMAFFLSRFIYCRKCRQNTQTLLTAESGTHGNLDLFLGVSKEHYHADDDVTINIKRRPLVFFQSRIRNTKPHSWLQMFILWSFENNLWDIVAIKHTAYFGNHRYIKFHSAFCAAWKTLQLSDYTICCYINRWSSIQIFICFNNLTILPILKYHAMTFIDFPIINSITLSFYRRYA